MTTEIYEELESYNDWADRMIAHITPRGLSDEEVRSGALRFINSIRTEYDLESLDELPRGTPGTPKGCPLAIAAKGLGDRSCSFVMQRTVMAESEAGLFFPREGTIRRYPAPPIVHEFIRRFDNGQLKDLIEAPAKPLAGLTADIDRG